MDKYTAKQIARFWSRIHCTTLDGCWLWVAWLDPDGYGVISIRDYPVKAHRMAWELAYGEIPDNLFVCHTCDNPACCNPMHLFLGTNQENTQDKMNKRRQARGEKQGAHKLTWEQVREIRDRYSKGDTSQRKLAKEYGVAQNTIRFVVTNKSWRTP